MRSALGNGQLDKSVRPRTVTGSLHVVSMFTIHDAFLEHAHRHGMLSSSGQLLSSVHMLVEYSVVTYFYSFHHIL